MIFTSLEHVVPVKLCPNFSFNFSSISLFVYCTLFFASVFFFSRYWQRFKSHSSVKPLKASQLTHPVHLICPFVAASATVAALEVARI